MCLGFEQCTWESWHTVSICGLLSGLSVNQATHRQQREVGRARPHTHKWQKWAGPSWEQRKTCTHADLYAHISRLRQLMVRPILNEAHPKCSQNAPRPLQALSFSTSGIHTHMHTHTHKHTYAKRKGKKEVARWRDSSLVRERRMEGGREGEREKEREPLLCSLTHFLVHGTCLNRLHARITRRARTRTAELISRAGHVISLRDMRSYKPP